MTRLFLVMPYPNAARKQPLVDRSSPAPTAARRTGQRHLRARRFRQDRTGRLPPSLELGTAGLFVRLAAATCGPRSDVRQWQPSGASRTPAAPGRRFCPSQHRPGVAPDRRLAVDAQTLQPARFSTRDDPEAVSHPIPAPTASFHFGALNLGAAPDPNRGQPIRGAVTDIGDLGLGRRGTIRIPVAVGGDPSRHPGKGQEVSARHVNAPPPDGDHRRRSGRKRRRNRGGPTDGRPEPIAEIHNPRLLPTEDPRRKRLGHPPNGRSLPQVPGGTTAGAPVNAHSA